MSERRKIFDLVIVMVSISSAYDARTTGSHTIISLTIDEVDQLIQDLQAARDYLAVKQ